MHSDSEQLAALSEEQWRDLYLRLRLFTWRRYKWLSKSGVDLDDLVVKAVSDTLEGKRHWPPVDEYGQPKANVSLFSFLCRVVESNVSHVWEQERRKISAGLIEPDYGALGFALEDLPVGSFEALLSVSPRADPGSAREGGTDSRAIYNELRDKLFDLVADDVELRSIVELIVADPDLKPREMAELLGLSLDRIRSAQKRLRRRLRYWKGTK